MSRLSDLLNPTPSSRASPIPQSPNVSDTGDHRVAFAPSGPGLVMHGAMDNIIVKTEPSGTASPIANGYATHDTGIAETIEQTSKRDTPIYTKEESLDREGSKSLPEPRPPKAATANGVKKKPTKKGRAAPKAKPSGSKPIKKSTNGAGKSVGANGTSATSAHIQDQEDDEDGEDDLDDDDDDGGVFCICRGPDDHTWMIGCDGECEDWFHGRCVDIHQKDADLIEKYICPNCYIKGTRQTTWKPMCRLEECRKPARVNDPSPSKYCSDAHGEEFFRRRVMQKTRRADGPPPSKRRQVEKFEPETNQAHLHGGSLARSEIKTLTDSATQSQDFQNLGSAVLPSDTAAENTMDTEDKGPNITEVNDDTCTPEEGDHLREVLDAAAKTRHSLNVLADKEKFLKIARMQAAQRNAEAGGGGGDIKKKETFKEVCGYDSRLAWNEDEFNNWRKTEEGQKALETETLPPVSTNVVKDADGDLAMLDNPAEEDTETQETVCQRKRCERHKTWWKIHYQSIVHEQNECYQRLEKLGDEARGIQERAVLKRREQEAG